jgi:hypothetical protein
LRLNVAVDDRGILGVGDIQSSTDLLNNFNYGTRRDELLAIGAPKLVKTPTGNILHRKETQSLPLHVKHVRVENTNDVGVVQSRKNHGFTQHLL